MNSKSDARLSQAVNMLREQLVDIGKRSALVNAPVGKSRMKALNIEDGRSDKVFKILNQRQRKVMFEAYRGARIEIQKQGKSLSRSFSGSCRKAIASLQSVCRQTSIQFRIGISSIKRFVATAAFMSAALAGAQELDAMIEWAYVGSEPTHTKYSAAEELSVASVGELEIVLQFGQNLSSGQRMPSSRFLANSSSGNF